MRQSPGQRTRDDVTTGVTFVVAILLTIIVAGIVCRLAPLGLSLSFRKWSGSVLWGGMFWCLAALIARGSPRLVILLLALSGAALSETVKLLHFPWLDALRATHAGAFLLGTHFACADLIACTTGACVTGLLMTHVFTDGNTANKK